MTSRQRKVLVMIGCGLLSLCLILLMIWLAFCHVELFAKLKDFKEIIFAIVSAPVLFYVWLLRMTHHDETMRSQATTNETSKENARNSLNHTKYETRYAELEKVKGILIKLKPLELKESPPSIVCQNDTETVNDVILALARLIDFLQDEAQHMQPIRRMAFILLQQTWKDYVRPIYEPNKEESRYFLDYFWDFFSRDKILIQFSKTLMRGLIQKSKNPNCAELTQPFFKEELDDLFLVGLNTNLCPNINLVIEKTILKKADFSGCYFGDNVTFKNITLWNNSFYCSIFYNTCMEDVYFEYDLETEENMVYSFYIEKM
jgi:hypothetical protein